MRSGRYAMDASSGGVGSDARGRDLRFLVALLGCVGRPVFVTGLHDREVLFSSIAATPGSEESGVGSRAEILLKSAGVFATEIPKLRQRASGVELYGERRVAGGMVSPFVMDVFTVFCGAGCGVEGEGFRIGVMRSPEESGFVREMERSLQALLVRYDLELVSVVGDGGGNVYDSPSVLREFGPGLFSRVHPEDTERLDTWLGSAVSEGEVCEYRTRDVAGEWRTVRSSVEIYGEKVLVGGKVVRSRVVRGGMGGELEPDFRALVTNLTEVVKICDPDGTIRYVSPSMKQTFGYEPEDMVGRNVLEYVHPEDLPYVVAKTQEAMESPEVARNVAAYRFLHADGDWRDVESSGVYLLEDPGVRGVIVNSRDVTTERDAERRLRESEERYRKLVEQVPGMIYMRDYHDHATLYDSPQLDAMLGYPPDTCARDPHYWMKIVHPEDVQLYRDAMVAGDAFSAEYRVLAADGREVWLKDDAVVVRDGAGEPLCWQGMRLDITDRKATEASLRESEERSRRNAWELSLLHGVRNAVQREMETEEIIAIGIEFIASSYGYTQVSAYTLRDGELKLRHQVGYDEVITSMPVERGIMGKTVREGRGILVEDVHASEEFVGAIEGIVSEVCVPLPGDGGETLGVLNLESVDGVVLDGEDLRIAVALGQTLGLAVSRARLYKKMRDTERKYRMLVEQIPAVTYVQSLSHDHTISYVSPQIAQMLGYEPWEFYADDALWYDVVHPDDRGKVLSEDNRTDRTREPFSMEYRMVGRGGEVVWITDEATLLLDESGEPLFWHGMLYNVTERKRFDEALRESEERFRSLVQNASDLIIILDRDQRSTYLSPSIEKIQGFSTEDALGRSAFENIHPDDADRIRSEFGRLLEDPTYEPVVDFRLRHRDGSWLHVEAVGRNLLDDPAVGGIVVNARDITARKLTEDALRESEARLSTVTSGAPIIFFAIDLDGVITLSKGKGLALLGLEEGAAVGENVFETFAHLTPMVEGVRRALRGEEAAVMLELRDLSFDAKYSPVRDERGVVTGVVGVATDMTGRRKLEKELEYRAFHDPLTGLANRALCMNRITHALQRADRDSCPVTILFMDLDDFKMVNDSLGHDTGDMLLVEAAERLRGCLRPGDTLARLGGDEFVIVLEATGLDEATKVARRIEELLQRPFRLGDSGQERYVTFSVGITVSEGSRSTAEDMLREADLAMYRAKAEGKASYAVFDSGMSARMMQRIDLESNLRRALDNFEFEVFYQPIVSISTGEISCLEALVRWRRPGWGLVSPGEFVALAEETSMILPIGQRVIEDACRNLSRWRESSGRSDLSVSVNLSARQFRHPGLKADIERVLEETNIPPESLRLEITENVVMSAGPETVTLTELKQLGVGLMIDDFGTGHSSLSYLKRLPVGYLKIDRSFCAGLLDGNAVDREIVAAVIRLGHATGLEVVAEGVESPKQLACLRELGCDFAQGFLFSRPIAAAEIPDILPPDPGRIVRIGSG